jgi:hypothetical protein
VSIVDNGAFYISGGSLFISDSSDLEANDISINDSSLTGNDSDVCIVNNGDVSITGDDTVSIDDATVSANNISVSDDSTISDGGSVSIIDNGTVSISGDFVDISDSADLEVNNISITGSTITADDNDVSINNNGSISITSGDTSAGDIDDASVSANNISICGSTISISSDSTISEGDSVSIVDDGYVSISAGDVGISDSSDLELDNISISGSTLTANNGDVSVTDNGFISITGDGTTVASISDSTLSANNITINNSTLTASGGDVDISDFGQVFGGPDTSDSDDISVNDILISGSTLDAYALDSVGGDVNISGNGAVELDNTTVNADGNVTITAEQAVANDPIYDESGGVTISGGSITAGSVATPKTLSITANGAAGTVINNGASLNAFYISVNSPDGILINQDGSSSTYTGNQLTLTAGNNAGQEIRVANADFSSFASINVSANTIWIVDTDLGSGIVNLGSQSGHVNVNTGYHPFDINLDEDIYNHVPITTPTQVTSGIGTTAGLFSHQN